MKSSRPELQLARNAPTKKSAKADAETPPDIPAEMAARGEAEFQRWLNGQPVHVLRALIRKHDLDSTRRTIKWKKVEKLATFLTEGIRTRATRGSSQRRKHREVIDHK